MSNTPSKVVLVTTGPPALNPRLVKEADALADAGHEVLVIYAYWNDWGDQFTHQMLPSKKWKAECAGGHPVNSPLTYFVSRLRFKIAKWLYFKMSIGLFRNGAVARCTPYLIKGAKKRKAGLYIGHNLGALPAVVKAARKNKAMCGFDAEDFHRLEIDDNTESVKYKITKAVEDIYLPQTNYATASSAEIAEAYRQLYPEKQFEVILNVFEKANVTQTETQGNCIKLFWFSQTIGQQRGIQDVITALNNLPKSNYELNLLGDVSEVDKEYFNQLAAKPFIHFHPPLPPDEVINFASQFDIGLALEPGFSPNNTKALSNKLFTYLQAGLAIIATNTEAQGRFLNDNPKLGRAYQPGDIAALTSILGEWQKNPGLVNTFKKNAIQAATKQFNWEIESRRFLKITKQLFTQE